ncbi:MFS transporter [Virgibacillus doumboii]|uniref:MFS transporter n=1 Tax=Virgibacillus doumboii TaxID=2697503 RepID=UPI0013E06D6F|nr:MFS transporter [Virgibacillus doumboii]
MGRNAWKYASILLFGIGLSNVGDWIYLIALNLIVLDMTGSPPAVAALYILKPLATLATNSWAGSLIDRLNKRNLMIFLDIFRAIFIAFLPAFSSLSFIYLLAFFINMASSMFEPASMTYITKLIPAGQRKRFNSLRSLIDSGGFLIGPAIAGMLFIIGTPIFAIYMNAIALFLSGIITMFMPNLEKNITIQQERLSMTLLKKDWHAVVRFSRQHGYIMMIYFLFSFMMVMATAIDSLEAAFAKEVLQLSDGKYGFLVSIAGAGIVVGAVINAVFVKKISTATLIGAGSIFVSVGYIVYAFSSGFFIAAIGFFVLSFSLAFANTGYYTFYQNNIPVDVMGRIGSTYGFIEAVLIIVMTSIMGIAAQLISIQTVVIAGTLIMLGVTGALFFVSAIPLKKAKYKSA